MGDDAAQSHRIRSFYQHRVAAGEAEFLQRGNRFAWVVAMGVGRAVAKRSPTPFPQFASQRQHLLAPEAA